jgi:hypothetical protein
MTGANGTEAQKTAYANFQNAPGYQSAVNYGQDQIQARAAASGQNLSGNTLAALKTYDTGQQLQAYQQNMSNLYAGAQIGQSAANTLTTASTASANNQGNYNLISGQYTGAGLANLGSQGNNALLNYYYGTRSGS